MDNFADRKKRRTSIQMKTFTFHDNAQGKWAKGPNGLFWDAPLIFSCEAEDILVADALCEKATGIKPNKSPGIACGISEKATYQFTCPACNKVSNKPGYCSACAQEANAFYDSLPTPEPTPETIHH